MYYTNEYPHVWHDMSCQYTNFGQPLCHILFDTTSGCGSPNWQGDNVCDDDNNNANCNYDGGDCCGDNVDC